MAEHKSGQIKFKQMRDQGAKHQIEEVGAKLKVNDALDSIK